MNLSLFTICGITPLHSWRPWATYENLTCTSMSL